MQETQEMWVWSLSQEEPLEEEMAAHSSILSWKFHKQKSLVDGVEKSQTWLSVHMHTYIKNEAWKS